MVTCLLLHQQPRRAGKPSPMTIGSRAWCQRPDANGVRARRGGTRRSTTCPRHTTRSSWARAAPVRRRRCCWPARATACSSSTARRFRATPMSTHVVQPLAVAALARWGLLDRLTATGCPPIHTYTFDFGPFTLAGSPGTTEAPVAYCPRRTVLDKLLVDAAAEAGAEIREGFTVDDVLMDERSRRRHRRSFEGRRSRSTERGPVVVGADGRHSLVARGRPARAVPREAAAARRRTTPTGAVFPMDGRFETYIRPHRGFAAAPTHDGLTMTVGGWPHAEFEANKKDVEGNFLKLFDLGAGRSRSACAAPSAKRRLRARRCRTSSASRSARAGCSSATPATSRTRSRRRGSTTPSATPSSCALRWTRASPGARSFDEAMGRVSARSRRTRAMPMYEFTCQLATLEPPPPEMQQLLRRDTRQSEGHGRASRR